LSTDGVSAPDGLVAPSGAPGDTPIFDHVLDEERGRPAAADSDAVASSPDRAASPERRRDNALDSGDTSTALVPLIYPFAAPIMSAALTAPVHASDTPRTERDASTVDAADNGGDYSGAGAARWDPLAPSLAARDVVASRSAILGSVTRAGGMSVMSLTPLSLTGVAGRVESTGGDAGGQQGATPGGRVDQSASSKIADTIARRSLERDTPVEPEAALSQARQIDITKRLDGDGVSMSQAPVDATEALAASRVRRVGDGAARGAPAIDHADAGRDLQGQAGGVGGDAPTRTGLSGLGRGLQGRAEGGAADALIAGDHTVAAMVDAKSRDRVASPRLIWDVEQDRRVVTSTGGDGTLAVADHGVMATSSGATVLDAPRGRLSDGPLDVKAGVSPWPHAAIAPIIVAMTSGCGGRNEDKAVASAHGPTDVSIENDAKGKGSRTSSSDGGTIAAKEHNAASDGGTIATGAYNVGDHITRESLQAWRTVESLRPSSDTKKPSEKGQAAAATSTDVALAASRRTIRRTIAA